MPDLDGLWVVVTRPAHQASPVTQALKRAGARVIPFPLIAIVAPDDDTAAREAIRRLDGCHMAVFVSPNAVTFGLALVHRYGAWPPQLLCAAVGSGTAAALAEAGLVPALVPATGGDSEALLALPELEDLRGRRIVIFRGAGGRELLADTLRRRGADVSYLECYRRVPAGSDPALLHRHWEAHQLDVFLITSSEALRILYRIVGEHDRKRLLKTALVVNHRRVAELAAQLGWRNTVGVAARPGDDAMIEALRRLEPAG